MPTFTPAAFDYYSAKSLDEAIRLLREHDDAKLIAGGQSLLAMMKLRLIEPKVLVDISKIPALDYLKERDGQLVIGALATHQAIHDSELVRSKCPLLSEAAGRIADMQIRNRGTIGGSISHADPSADYLPVLLALEGSIVAEGAGKEMVIGAKDFFVDTFTTALGPAEVAKEVCVPIIAANEGQAYVKFIRREAEFATVNVAVRLIVGRGGLVEKARVALGAVANTAIRATAVEEILEGKKISEDLISKASKVADQGTDPPSDIRGSAAYRKHLAKVWAKRALLRAFANLEARRDR
jgi:carbon-monoxide dehydrogenase medium subunit